ncbi:HAMP domain-containing sensor histidine kinase [Prevotella sp. P6B4]|uniref:tetratricopeptide repeat-containing sensor histidine kinase n=1 Tax=Prevotella sp. P6B4 TaxID=1410614 RepID=UPI0009DE7510|nr:HAMP domain-containing sensor histidine kinase [Prevotella sp. P6B4]
MRRILSVINLLIGCLILYAQPIENKNATSIEKESEARWQQMVSLKNNSQTQKLADEANAQMEWFRKNNQWENYYRTWQLKANTLSALGKLQLSLQETQQMLSDAQKRNNKLGRAMAYKQIGVIYLNMKQTEPAVEALKHYAELMKDDDDISSLSNIFYRIAKAYDYDKQFDKELQVANDWYKFLIKKVGKRRTDEVRECYNSCYQARAAAYIGLKKFEDAKLSLDTAGHHAHIINKPLSLHHYYKMQARYFQAKGDANQALLYTDSVKMITDEKDDHTDEIRAQSLMQLGQEAEAASIYQRLYHEKDSVFGRETRQHLDELNTLFQVDELKTEQQHTKFLYTIVASSSIVLALLVLLIFGWRTAIRLKKINDKLRIANEKAKVSSKMKSEFIRNISHEIRTPLNIVSGFTQVLTSTDMDLPKSEKRDIQERVTESTDRIIKLVDRMLMLSDVNSETEIEREDHTDVKTIIKMAISHSGIDHHTRPGNKTSAVTLQILNDDSTNAVTMLTNKQHASRILGQLLENACKFTHEGSITLKTEFTNHVIRFIVEDTGIGIPAEEAEHIFEEFVQLDEFADGTGAGLTISRSVALRMGGKLWLDTSYKQGARFIFELLRG